MIDIRASPYDALEYHTPDGPFDLTPIRVETLEGRQQYQAEQEGLWRRAEPLRARLVEAYDKALSGLQLDQGPRNFALTGLGDDQTPRPPHKRGEVTSVAA